MKQFITFTLIGILLTSCGTTLLTDTKNISNKKNTYNKILVIGKSKDQLTRSKFEDLVVANLKEQGIDAISSFEYGLKIEDNVDEKKAKEFKAKFEKSGFDGVILTTLVDTQQTQHVEPGNSGTVYYPTTYYGRFRRYYGYRAVTYWEPDELTTGTNYILESTLFKIDLDADNLQWIGRFKVDSNNGLNGVQEKYAKELVDAIVEESIVKS